METSFSADKTVVLGADHNGVALKAQLKEKLKQEGYHCVDVGPHMEGQKVDYVDYARLVGSIVSNHDARWGVLVCGTGVGMSIAANRFPEVRASLVHSMDVAEKTREHNDANVLCLGSWVNPPEVNLAIAKTWFDGKFGEGRHVPRVEKTKGDRKDKIVFTNGIFDIIHPGHIELLKFSKSLGSKLIVGINSDRATKILKGESRPINNEHDRKAVLEKFDFVDEVVIFDDTKTKAIIAEIHPDVVVKGGEWTAGEVRERDEIPADIEVKVFPLLMEKPGVKYSTTNIVNRIQAHGNAVRES